MPGYCRSVLNRTNNQSYCCRPPSPHRTLNRAFPQQASAPREPTILPSVGQFPVGSLIKFQSLPAAVSLLELRELCHVGIHLLDPSPSVPLASSQYDMMRAPSCCFYCIGFAYCFLTSTDCIDWLDCVTRTCFRYGRKVTDWSDHDTCSFPRPIYRPGTFHTCPLPALNS